MSAAATDTGATPVADQARKPERTTTVEVQPAASGTLPVVKPTVGRKIYYWPTDAEKVQRRIGEIREVAMPSEGQPLDANIVRVWNDKLINIGGFDADGIPFRKVSVRLVQPEDGVVEGGGFASWMDYQIQKANEAASK